MNWQNILESVNQVVVALDQWHTLYLLVYRFLVLLYLFSLSSFFISTLYIMETSHYREKHEVGFLDLELPNHII